MPRGHKVYGEDLFGARLAVRVVTEQVLERLGQQRERLGVIARFGLRLGAAQQAERVRLGHQVDHVQAEEVHLEHQLGGVGQERGHLP